MCMDEITLIVNAIDKGIKNDMAFKTLLQAAIAARGYDNVQMMLYQASIDISDGHRPAELYLDQYSMIYG